MFVLCIEGKCLLIICQLIIYIWACPREKAAGSGFSLQVLAIRASWLWAFRFNPSRSYMAKLGVYTSILLQVQREGCKRKSFCLSLAKDRSGSARRRYLFAPARPKHNKNKNHRVLNIEKLIKYKQ